MSNARGNQSIIASHPPIIEKQRGHGTSKWTAPLRVYSWREDKTSPHIQEIAFDLLQELGITRVYTVYPDKYPIRYPLLSLIHYEHHEIFPMKSQNPNRKDDEQLNSWDAFLFAFNNFGCIDMIKKSSPTGVSTMSRHQSLDWGENWQENHWCQTVQYQVFL